MRDRGTTDQVQLTKLRKLLAVLRKGNPFYEPIIRAALIVHNFCRVLSIDVGLCLLPAGGRQAVAQPRSSG